jgi:hypothetical protein
MGVGLVRLRRAALLGANRRPYTVEVGVVAPQAARHSCRSQPVTEDAAATHPQGSRLSTEPLGYPQKDWVDSDSCRSGCFFPQPRHPVVAGPGFTWNHRHRDEKGARRRTTSQVRGRVRRKWAVADRMCDQRAEASVAGGGSTHPHVSPAFSTSGSTAVYAVSTTIALWVTGTGARVERRSRRSEVDNSRDIHR